MNLVFAFCGKKRSGKNTAAEMFKEVGERLGYTVRMFAFADELREHLEIMNPIVGMLTGEHGYAGLVKDNGIMPKPITWSEAVEYFGYEGAKDEFPEMRRLMQVYGTEVVRQRIQNNFWAQKVRKEIELFFEQTHSLHIAGKMALITDCRFENEAVELEKTKQAVVGFMHTVRPLPGEKVDYHASEDLHWVENGLPRLATLNNDIFKFSFKNKTKNLAETLIQYSARHPYAGYDVGFDSLHEWGTIGLTPKPDTWSIESFPLRQDPERLG